MNLLEPRQRGLSIVERPARTVPPPLRGPFILGKSGPSQTASPRSDGGSVWLLGYDPVLQFTRGEILRRAGFAVEQIDVTEVIISFRTCPPQLSILCQTIDHETAKLLALKLRRLDPAAVILRFPDDACPFDESPYFNHIFEVGIVSAETLLKGVRERIAPRLG